MDAVSEPKISVIVPIYNAQAYLRKCLDSIAAQTHKNLEVILVDDGSPDNCPAICDEYAANDPRFKAIHKENGGPGSGYNAGLDAATGEWIGFVDNDDWVEPDMFEYLLAGARRHGVKMAACGFYRTDGRREKDHASGQECVLSGRQAVGMILEGRSRLTVVPWQKLYARELWDGIRFTEAENTPPDFLPAFAVLMRTRSVVCLPDAKYYWRMRRGSYSSDRSLRYQISSYLVWEELYNGMLAQEPELRAKAGRGLAQTVWWVWNAGFSSSRAERRAAMPQLREISAFCRAHVNWLVESGASGWAGRMAFRLASWSTGWSFALSHILWKFYAWKHGIKHGVAL